MTANPVSVGLGLMCKPPRPGATKTRLAATVGHEAAARLSRAFLEDSARAVLKAADASPITPKAFHRLPDAADDLSAILGPRWPMVHADQGDLGATMLDVLRQLLVECPAGAMVMGADVPLIVGADITLAAEQLRLGNERTVVIIPSTDGGYCLIGVRSADTAAPLFEPMAWSTSSVLDETLARAASHGLKPVVLQAHRDIDDGDDLDWLRETLKTKPDASPSTRAALAALTDAATNG